MPSLSKTRLDVDAMDQGIWCTFYTDSKTNESIEFRIRSSRSPGYTKVIHQLATEENRGNTVVQSRDPLALEDMQRAAAGEYLIADWRGLQEDDGTSIPFSTVTARKLMTDRRYTDLYEWVQRIADDRARFREATIEQTAKN